MPGMLAWVWVVCIVLVYPLWDYRVAYPRMMRTIASGRPGGRALVYLEIIAMLWGMSAISALVLAQAGRPLSELGLVGPPAWATVVTMVLTAALLGLFAVQSRAIARLDEPKRARIRARQGAESELIPRTGSQRLVFAAVALSAGVCEELIYRGFLVWAFRPLLGPFGAAFASSASFATAHAYQGRKGVLRSGVIGLFFAVLAIASGSIVPGMVLHALVDLIGGESGHAVYREAADPQPADR